MIHNLSLESKYDELSMMASLIQLRLYLSIIIRTIGIGGNYPKMVAIDGVQIWSRPNPGKMGFGFGGTLPNNGRTFPGDCWWLRSAQNIIPKRSWVLFGYLYIYTYKLYIICIYPICNPWCWNIYQHLPHKWPSFVGKYTSTMVRIWVYLYINIYPLVIWHSYGIEMASLARSVDTLWQTYKKRTGKSPFSMGKSTISMCHFQVRKLLNYQRVAPLSEPDGL